ncbi:MULTISPECIES: helix-turn-helix transcriptional regulator [unclassified Microbacterium]|uniref:helix-turn-helix transcriptional regulator n=1 Tax=unclassified Microbacterium TaxID=2609290 RepID=UPI000EAA0AB5|nr:MULTISPECIES: helix-turn-helix transcriptional regulator [unclassified Microbacterium]MBT2484623.1 helix-turn-helix transcriptional regulator [Microbacterium sp. ISL-108]RKN67514.1 XRE family transcriptional regulator [Microbacterium sp. CGR2]
MPGPGRDATAVDKTFGETLREARERKGLSQAALAEEMQQLGFEFQQQTVYKIESGNRKATIGEAAALARALQLPDVTSLVNGKHSLAITLLLRPLEAAYEDVFFASQRMLDAQMKLARHLTRIDDGVDLPDSQVDQLRDALRYDPVEVAEEVRGYAEKRLRDDDEISETIRNIIAEAWRPSSDG